MTEADPDRRRVKTVDTALDLLEALSGSGALTLGELADRHSLAKSTVHRHLKTLLDRGDVVHEANRYRLSLRFLDMGNSAQTREPAYVLAEPKVEELADRTDERAQFVVEEHGRAVYVHIESGEHAVKTNTHVGKHNPIHASAGGLAILAHADRERVEAIVDRRGLECLTDYTITDREALFEELEAIRDRGYSISDQGHIEGLRAIGAPVMSPDGNVIGALSISGPTNRLQVPAVRGGTAEPPVGIDKRTRTQRRVLVSVRTIRISFSEGRERTDLLRLRRPHDRYGAVGLEREFL